MKHWLVLIILNIALNNTKHVKYAGKIARAFAAHKYKVYNVAQVRKRAYIRNRYHQVPHLRQDTNGKVTNSPLDITNESQEVSSFQAGDHKASTNIRQK